MKFKNCISKISTAFCFQNTLNHVNRILLHCNGFTEMQDIVTLIAHSRESTVNFKYTVNLTQKIYFFKTFEII